MDGAMSTLSTGDRSDIPGASVTNHSVEEMEQPQAPVDHHEKEHFPGRLGSFPIKPCT